MLSASKASLCWREGRIASAGVGHCDPCGSLPTQDILCSMIRAGRQLDCFVFLIAIKQSQCNWESLARDIAQIFAEYLKWLLCSHAGGSQLEVKLVLLWKHNMRIEYLAVTPWPLDPSKRSTWVEVTMEGSYDILHDISCTMRKPITSLYRTTVIRRFWNTLQRWAGPSPTVLSPM